MSLELLELRQSIMEARYHDALRIIDILDDMSRKSITLNIKSYLIRAFMHLIKMVVEKRLTKSWLYSIRDSLLKIQDLNVMENKKSYYLKPDDWAEYLEETYDDALYEASLEVAGGQYEAEELARLVDKEMVTAMLAQLLADTYHYNRKELARRVGEQVNQQVNYDTIGDTPWS